MPILIAACASLVSGAVLVLGRFTELPYLGIVSLASVAAMGLAGFLLRGRHAWFLLSAILFGAFLVAYGLGRLLFSQSSYGWAAFFFALLAVLAGAAGMFFLLATADLAGWHDVLHLAFLGLAVATALLGLWGGLVNVSLSIGWTREAVVPTAIALGTPVWLFHVVVDLATGGLLYFLYSVFAADADSEHAQEPA